MNRRFERCCRGDGTTSLETRGRGAGVPVLFLHQDEQWRITLPPSGL